MMNKMAALAGQRVAKMRRTNVDARPVRTQR